MFLDESKIVWIGNGKKPQEITLPKHLRVVTTHDPPFVYTTPVSDSSQCSTLGTKQIEGAEVVKNFIFFSLPFTVTKSKLHSF